MIRCPACEKEYETLCYGDVCHLCYDLVKLGLPYKYLKATKDLYKGRLMKCFVGNDSLYIHGNIGTGKTWLMAAIMREHVLSTKKSYGKRGIEIYTIDAQFVSFPELTFQIRASMDKGSSHTESSIMDKYGNSGALFFDDIGAEKTTDYMRSALFVLMERRNTRKNCRTIITSNLSLNQLAGQHGERVASRISEMCRIIKLSGSDRRIK